MTFARSLMVVSAMLCVAGVASAKQAKVDVCHQTGNGGSHIINVSQNAVAAHIAHGDNEVGAETCDGIDNDCDGTVDEVAPVPVTCGQGACAASGELVCQNGALVNTCTPAPPSQEQCDGLDNDCDGTVDDVAPVPVNCGVGECAATGELVCQNGALSSTCSPGQPSPEVCDMQDNDCDGEEDEGDVCDSTIYGSCPQPDVFSTCSVDLATGAVQCDNGNPVTLFAMSAEGPVFRLDMTNWDVVVSQLAISNPSGWVLNLGNSPTNNGYSGDGSSNTNDSEAQMLGNGVSVYRNDFTGGVALSIPGAVDPAGDQVKMVVCDSYFGWESSTAIQDVTDPGIFQIDGDEPDPQAGGTNDQFLYLGIGRIVGGTFRNGSGVNSLTFVFGRTTPVVTL